MRYNNIIPQDVVNGVGVACTIFFQGCSHHCHGCFNKETWDENLGNELTKDIIDKFIELCKKPYIDCISITGGDALQQDCIEFSEFLDKLKSIHKPIFLWSGYTYEEIISMHKWYVLDKINYLIDGRYIEELRDTTLHLRGSSNQRIIDCKESIKLFKIDKLSKPIEISFN